MIHLTPGFCRIRHFTNIDQLCLIFPLYREVLVTPQCVWQNWNRQWLRTIFSHLEVNTHFVSMEPTVSPWRSSSGFITDLSWPKYGLLSKGIVPPSYLWHQPRPLPRASRRCCVDAQQVRSGNWSSWKPREKQLSRWLSHIKWTMKPQTQVQHICTVLWKSCAWGSWGRNEWKESWLCCLCLFNMGWLSKSLTVHGGLGLATARVAQSSPAVRTGVCVPLCTISRNTGSSLTGSTSKRGTSSMLKWSRGLGLSSPLSWMEW